MQNVPESWLGFQRELARRARREVRRQLHGGLARLMLGGLAGMVATAAVNERPHLFGLGDFSVGLLAFAAVIVATWVCLFSWHFLRAPHELALELYRSRIELGEQLASMKLHADSEVYLPQPRRDNVQRIRELGGQIVELLRHNLPVADSLGEMWLLASALRDLEVEPGASFADVVRNFVNWAQIIDEGHPILDELYYSQLVSSCESLLRKYPVP